MADRSNFKLGVIGAGAMGGAILTQVIEKGVISPAEIIIYDIDQAKSRAVHQNIAVADSVSQVLDCENVLFAVKPQSYAEIAENNDFSRCINIISIMAGVKTATLRAKLKNESCGILRAMPNMPCKIGEGITALAFDKINLSDKEFFFAMFSACGDIIEISEDKFDAVTCVSGSGPAYVYMFLQGMIEGGTNGGLTYEESKRLAVATMRGGAGLAAASGEELDSMIDKVCSKGGTTIEAVNVYRDKHLVAIIAQGADACRAKSRALSEKL